jgi:hypothetical protein
MGYSDQKYFSNDLHKVAAAVAFGTATASGTSTKALPSAVYMPVYEQNTTLGGLEVVAATAPNSAQGGLFQVLNGTNTIITATYTAGAAAGAVLWGSYTGTYTCTGTATKDAYKAVPANVFLSGNAPTIQLVLNTATASADTTGTWDIYTFDTQHV